MFFITDHLKKWYSIAREVIVRPRQFFHELPAQGSLKEPFGFAIVAIFIASFLSALSMPFIIFPRATLSWLASPSLDTGTFYGILILFALFLYSFFSTLITLPLSAAINHVLLKICGAHGNFTETLRISCYYMAISLIASPAFFISFLVISVAEAIGLKGILYALLFIPVMVLILAIAVYSFYVLFIGFSLVHGISMKRVFMAVIGIPGMAMILIFALIIGLVFIAGYSSSTLSSYSDFPGEEKRPFTAIVNLSAPYGSAPQIDGLYSSENNWNEAFPVVFTSSGVNYTLSAKHDGSMLYILLMWNSKPEWKNSISLYFEQDGDSHDHNLRTGLNDEKYNGAIQYGPSNLADAHYKEGVMESEDGAVSGNYRDGQWIQEWVVPLQSGDPGDIYVEQFPSTLGFAIIPWKSDGSRWPLRNTMPYSPETWGNLMLLDSDEIRYPLQQTTLVASAGTPPVIDGYYTPEDGWEMTQKLDIISRSADYYTLAAKHDRENLYFLLTWQGEPGFNSAFIHFEQDGLSHDHTISTGVIDVKHNNGENFYLDAHGQDGQWDGEKNGFARTNFSNGSWVYEWVVPLNSGDKDDISVDRFPSTLGLMVDFSNMKKNVLWPNNASRYSSEFWGDLEIVDTQ